MLSAFEATGSGRRSGARSRGGKAKRREGGADVQLCASTIGRHKASLDVRDKRGVTGMPESGVGLPWNGEQV